MKILEKIGCTTGKLTVRKKVDNSGDCEYMTYDIMSVYQWGANCIVYEIDNPNDAAMFAASPAMFEALVDLVRQHENWDSDRYIAVIEAATGNRYTWEQIKEMMEENNEN